MCLSERELENHREQIFALASNYERVFIANQEGTPALLNAATNLHNAYFLLLAVLDTIVTAPLATGAGVEMRARLARLMEESLDLLV